MKLPASSNSNTGGGAMLFWSLRTELGRCRIQAWPWLSIDTLETCPHTHLLGRLGHDGSTSKCGIMRGAFTGACAETEVVWPDRAMMATNAMTTERALCIGIPPRLVIMCSCSIFPPI